MNMEYKFSEIFKWKSGKAVELKDGNIPVYGSNGIIGYTDISKYNNKIIVGRVGAYCGSVEYCEGDFNATDNTLIATCDTSKIQYYYSYYLLKLMRLNNYAGGAAQPLITQGILKHLKCDIPSISVQNEIVKILSAFDKALETNNRHIKILEQMAENIYKEWFVRFRFPGYEKAEFVDGVPKGWKVCKLKDIIKFNPKYDFKQQYSYINIPMAALSTSGMSIDKSQITIEEKSSGTHFVNGDVLFAKITPCLENGKTGLVNCLNDDEVGTGSTEFIVMHGVKVDSFFTYCIARDELFRKQAINSMNGADGRQRADLTFIKKIKWLLPSDELLVRFKRFTDSVIKQIEMFNEQNQNLIKQRDYLLPRLMSGKLQV